MSPENPQEPDRSQDSEGPPTYDEVVDEVSQAPVVGSPPPVEVIGRRPTHGFLTSLQKASRGAKIETALPQLTDDERGFLVATHDITTGKRRIAMKDAARLLGLSQGEYRKRERNLIDKIGRILSLEMTKRESQ